MTKGSGSHPETRPSTADPPRIHQATRGLKDEEKRRRSLTTQTDSCNDATQQCPSEVGSGGGALEPAGRRKKKRGMRGHPCHQTLNRGCRLAPFPAPSLLASISGHQPNQKPQCKHNPNGEESKIPPTGQFPLGDVLQDHASHEILSPPNGTANSVSNPSKWRPLDPCVDQSGIGGTVRDRTLAGPSAKNLVRESRVVHFARQLPSPSPSLLGRLPSPQSPPLHQTSRLSTKASHCRVLVYHLTSVTIDYCTS